ncbi:MAG: hypothetical protein PVI23_16145 [Maricaulaceae bacterium]|jgi:hypothetical protein
MKRVITSLFAAGAIAMSAGAQEIPRMPDGKPDFNGVWQVMNTANWDLEPHAARSALQLREGPYVPVPSSEVVALGAVGAVPAGLGVVEGGEIPYTPEALERRNENRDDWVNRDPEIKCYLPGIPRANYMQHLPFQIFQSDSALFFAYEYAGAVRNVYLEDPGPAPIDSWMGQSVASWDGDTLEIEVTAQNGQPWLDRSGNFYSAQAVVNERFTYVDANMIEYEATITDPATFTEPWTMRMNLYRRRGDDAQLQQFKCVEFVEELMYGHLRREPLE